MRPSSVPKSTAVAVTFVWVLLAGCAHFQLAGYRPVADEAPRRIAVVAESLVSYGPLEVKSLPSTASPVLRVSLAKTIAQTVRYEARSHQEAVYTRQRSNIEANKLVLGVLLGFPLLYAPKQVPLFLGLDALYVLVLPPPPPDSQAKPVPGSDGVLVSYQREALRIPAAGESLVTEAGRMFLTDGNGIASLHVNPSWYDLGFRIRHAGARDSYLLRRIQRTRATTADWVETARQLHLGVEAGMAIRDLITLAASGPESAPAVLTVVIDAGLGLVIHYAIERLGTQTESYYDWVVIVVR